MKVLEKYINFVGEKISYLIPVMVALMVFVIISRYFFGIGRTGIQELVMYFHALVFLGCAGYVMNHDEHVRVDSFYRESSKKFKNVVNLIGTLTLLMPFIIVTFLMSYPYVIRSWKILEGSPETSGLNATYIYKTTLIIFPILLFIQALVILFSSINNLKTKK